MLRYPWSSPPLCKDKHNPLSPKSDQLQFSPNNMTARLREKVMRTNKIIIKLKMLWSFIKFSQLILYGNVWRSVWRISMWIFGKSVKQTPCRGAAGYRWTQRSGDISPRSKRFRLVSEQRKTEERDFRFWLREKWNESQKIPLLFPSSSTLPPLSLAPFFTRSLTLVPLSLLRACYAGYGNISA